MYSNAFNMIMKYTREKYWILLQLILRKLNTIAQSHQVKERSKSIHNTDILPREILLLKTPLSIFYNEPRNHETIQCILSHKNLMHSPDYLTLIQKKSNQHLANSQPVFSLPCSWNPCGMKSLFFRNFSLTWLRKYIICILWCI